MNLGSVILDKILDKIIIDKCLKAKGNNLALLFDKQIVT